MENAACVTVGNRYIKKRAEAAGASRIELVPTVVDTQKYGIRFENHRRECLHIGWIGTPKTWKGSAQPVYEILAGTIQSAGATFRAIGASMEPYSAYGFESVPWTEDDEVALIQSLDVGIMPLQDDPWTQGKCGYKLIQYMACGLPVIASPIGVNTEIVQHGVNGFLAKTEAEWCYFVEKLLSEPELREKMGAAGRRLVQQCYSLDTWAPKIVDILASIK
jgi:glycosyltransferase involved in cell wall biosynthesis